MDCPICAQALAGIKETLFPNNMTYEISCPRCGKYICSEEFKQDGLHDGSLDETRHLLSGAIREMDYKKIKKPSINTKSNLTDISQLVRIPKDEDIEAKSTKILEYIKAITASYGSSVEIEPKKDVSIGYSKNDIELAAHLELLEDMGYIVRNLKGHSIKELLTRLHTPLTVTLTAKGWKFLTEKNQKETSKKNKAFIAIWFDKEEKRKPFAEAIKATLESKCGLEGIYINNLMFPETIMEKALSEIRESTVVIIDLTGDRSAVAYEAGFATALGIQTIYVCEKNMEAAHFYARHFQCYVYKDIDHLKEIIESVIKARLPKN